MAPPNARPNRLLGSASPYLRQHAFNPVDWRPWGPEAFADARARNVPIFLSIGYSTCYWCHVMERESFEDATIADQLSAGFVPIKVDREERPDVDEIMMAATVLMTGHGGWPMSVFLEPDTLRPFYCGTYFPARSHGPAAGRPTFPDVLAAMSEAFSSKRDAVREQAQRVHDAVREHLDARSEPVALGSEHVSRAIQQLLGIFDQTHGGFGRAPKFPQVVFLEFLLDARPRAGDDSTADAIERALRGTLDAMALGGINDQIGGGFHRYSVDARWTVPHFEKMLYDQAQLAAIYARAARWFGDSFYERVARRTLQHVQRDLTHASGLFFAALDAEVDHREGLNYLWTPADLDALPATITSDDRVFLRRVLGLDGPANFQDPHHPSDPPRWVLRLADRPDRLARALNMGEVEFLRRFDELAATLLAVRSARPQPHRDDKAILAWNAMMIHAFATAADALEDPTLLAPAHRAADALLARLTKSDGSLARSVLLDARSEASSPADAAPAAILEDHAALILALAALARGSIGPVRQARIDQAVGVLARARRFFDPAGIFDTTADQADLFVRARSTHDGATPSGNSMMLHALLDLADLAQDASLADHARSALASISSAVDESPVGTVNSTRALLRLLVEHQGLGTPGRPAAAATPSQMDARATGTPGDLGASPVSIFAAEDRVIVGPNRPAQLTLVIRIDPGHHIIAADPGDALGSAGASLVPLRVGIVHGTGVAAFADYPPGESFQPSPDVPAVLVHRGTVELRVALERSGAWTGRPLLSVTYQACRDDACLAPTTVELDIALDRA